MKKTTEQKAIRAMRRKQARQTPHPVNMYDLSSAGRAARRAKVYPFSSTRQDVRTARSQVTDPVSNTMRTLPARFRFTEEQARRRIVQNHG